MPMSVSRELKRRVRRYEPCLPRLANESPVGPGWIHEIKHDGFRILAELKIKAAGTRSRRPCPVSGATTAYGQRVGR